MSEYIGGTLEPAGVERMLSIQSLINNLESVGVQLYAYAGKIKILAPAGKIDDQTKQEIAALKPSLICYLHRRTYAHSRLRGLIVQYPEIGLKNYKGVSSTAGIARAVHQYIVGETGPSHIDTAFHEWRREQSLQHIESDNGSEVIEL